MRSGGRRSKLDQTLKVAAAVHDAKNQNVRTFNQIQNDVLANRKAAHAGAELSIASGLPVGNL